MLLTALALRRRAIRLQIKKGKKLKQRSKSQIHPNPESGGSGGMLPRSGAAPRCRRREATPQLRHPAVKHQDEPPGSEETLFGASSNLPPAGPAGLGLLLLGGFPKRRAAPPPAAAPTPARGEGTEASVAGKRRRNGVPWGPPHRVGSGCPTPQLPVGDHGAKIRFRSDGAKGNKSWPSS